jgi:hypothetical protein
MLSVLALAALAACTCAQTTPQVDTPSVYRQGNLVQLIDGTWRGECDMLFGQVMGPPKDDNDKWFISVITMRNCPQCLKLKKDWETSPELLHLARPNLAEQKESWSHFNYYDKDDKSQSWRLDKLKIGAYPTVLVQPPRDGKYGDPKTVVYQGVYQGDPKELAEAIRSALRRYLAKFPVPVRSPINRSAVGLDPPWSPTPKVDPNSDLSRIFPKPKPPDTVVPPPDAPDPDKPSTGWPWWVWAAGAMGGFLLLVAVAVVMQLVRQGGLPQPQEDPPAKDADPRRPMSTEEQIAVLLGQLSKEREDRKRRDGILDNAVKDFAAGPQSPPPLPEKKA